MKTELSPETEALIAEIDVEIDRSRRVVSMADLAITHSDIVSARIGHDLIKIDAEVEEAMYNLRRAGYDL